MMLFEVSKCLRQRCLIEIGDVLNVSRQSDGTIKKFNRPINKSLNELLRNARWVTAQKDAPNATLH